MPDDVIAGIADLGPFGLSIPEAYGGSQQGRADDTAMVVASEVLERMATTIGPPPAPVRNPIPDALSVSA